MDEVKWLAVIIGVAGALIGVYFRENLRRALIQKRIAAQLNAYLSYWEMDLIKTDLGVLIVIVQHWSKEREAAIRKNGKKGFNDVWDKQKAQLKDLTNLIKSGDSDFQNSLNANHQLLRKMPDAVFQAMMDELTVSRDSLLQSRTFISDHDAAELSSWFAQRVVSLRGNLVSLLMHFRILSQTLRNSESVDFMSLSDTYVQIIEKLFDVTYEMQTLKNSTQHFSQRSLMRLAIDNMRFSA